MSYPDPPTRLIINGKPTSCVSGKQIPLIDPSTGSEWLKVDEAGDEDVEEAVKYAESAWRPWNALPGYVKATTIRKLIEIILKNADMLKYYESKGNGKPLASMQWDIDVTVGILQYAAALAETDSSTVSTLSPGHLNYVVRSPYGVTAVPWNVPMIMFAYKAGPAVAAGNAIIIKSSEKAPVTSLILGQLAIEAGFPPGLIQVLSGYGPTVGAALALHMKIRKIGFTGSHATGRLVQQMAAKSNLKDVTLELGGKSPNIIFEDADIENAVSTCADSILNISGQSCFAASRIYVQSSIKDKFLDVYKAALKNVKPGPHLDKTTSHGPQVDRAQFQRVSEYLKCGREDGKAIIGGNALDTTGYFIEPTIFSDIPDDSKVNKEEVFGPVVVVHTFEGEDEAVQRANDSEYGLYAAVFTKDIDRALRVSAALEAGNVGINCTSPTLFVDMPFGGYKASGSGRELGPEALRIWQEVKSVYVKIGEN